MLPECLPFAKLPHTTALFADFLAGSPKVRQFYGRSATAAEWIAEEAQAISYDGHRRQRVAAILERQNRAFGASPQALANIGRLRDGACAIVTGQQVALFGGPLFSILKALTAVRTAEQASRNGIDCVPVFWLATEDHDLAEVNHAVLPAGDGSLRTLATPTHGAEGAPIANIRFGPEIKPLVAEAAALLGSSEITDLLREAYAPGATFGGAFARLFATAFAEHGVILLDAADAELHAVAKPVYEQAVRRASELDAELLARGKALHDAGYHEQVKVTASSTLLFALQGEARTPIHRHNGQFTIGDEKLSESELLERIAAAPERFSANVLLRPVVQDYLLPTVAYVGGPAEVAYFAQAEVVYRELLGRATPVLPRLSATLVEPHAKRLLDRYRLSVADAFQPEESLRELLAERTLPADLQANFDAATASLQASLEAVTASLQRLDPTLVDAARRAGAKMQYQLGRLRTRAANAELRRSEVLARHAAQLSSALYPHRGLQERTIGAAYFLARYPELLTALLEGTSASCPDHQVVYL